METTCDTRSVQMLIEGKTTADRTPEQRVLLPRLTTEAIINTLKQIVIISKCICLPRYLTYSVSFHMVTVYSDRLARSCQFYDQLYL